MSEVYLKVGVFLRSLLLNAKFSHLISVTTVLSLLLFRSLELIANCSTNKPVLMQDFTYLDTNQVCMV